MASPFIAYQMYLSGYEKYTSYQKEKLEKQRGKIAKRNAEIIAIISKYFHYTYQTEKDIPKKFKEFYENRDIGGWGGHGNHWVFKYWPKENETLEDFENRINGLMTSAFGKRRSKRRRSRKLYKRRTS